MRKGLITMVAVSALSVPFIASAAARHRVRFTTTIVGAALTVTQSAYKAHDSVFGNGAGVQDVKLSATGGSDSEVTYYGNASAKSKGTFKLGTPDANGIAKVTGQGRDVSGTGKAKGLSSTYTYNGTYNTKTSVYKVKLTGTYTF